LYDRFRFTRSPTLPVSLILYVRRSCETRCVTSYGVNDPKTFSKPSDTAFQRVTRSVCFEPSHLRDEDYRLSSAADGDFQFSDRPSSDWYFVRPHTDNGWISQGLIVVLLHLVIVKSCDEYLVETYVVHVGGVSDVTIDFANVSVFINWIFDSPLSIFIDFDGGVFFCLFVCF